MKRMGWHQSAPKYSLLLNVAFCGISVFSFFGILKAITVYVLLRRGRTFHYHQIATIGLKSDCNLLT